MLSEAQLAHLEHLVHSISAELHIEEATLDAQQTLTLCLFHKFAASHAAALLYGLGG